MFVATTFEVSPEGRAVPLPGHSAGRPQRLQMSQSTPGQTRATTTVWQTDRGVELTPVSQAGVPKLSDAFGVEVDFDPCKATGEETAE